VPRQPTASKKAPARRSGPRPPAPSKGPVARAPARRSGSRALTPPPGGPPAGGQTGDHLRDLWGGGLLLLAALSALGLYFSGSAGLLGVFLVGVYRGLFGVFGLLAPVALAAGGVVLLREPRPANRRILIGAALLFVAVAGLWHLASNAPGFGAATPDLHRAAGWFGAVVALPLRAVAATPGAVVLLVAVLFAGGLVLTATPPRVLVRAVLGTFVQTGEQAAERRARGGADRPRRRRRRDRTVVLEEPEDGRPAPPADDEAPTTVHDDEAPTTVLDDEAPATVLDDALPVFAGAGETSEPAGTPALSDTQLLPRGLRHGDGAATLLEPRDREWEGYELPPLELFHTGKAAVGNKRALDQMRTALERTLRQFGVDAVVARMHRGPTVTRFEIELGEGVKVSSVTKLADDISYALATAEIRIVAPIPGKSAIGIEVPNRERDLITLGDVLRSPEAAAQRHPLTAGLGVDIAGNSVLVNLAAMPHLLIAGATGSGKSVTMNGIVTSVITRATPAQVRMILIDPKRVELNHYEGAPHLLTPVVTDPKRATEALAWTVKEMEDRYERLALLGYRNIDTYNTAVRDGTVRAAPALSGRMEGVGSDGAGLGPAWEPLPYILCIIDELADLMMVAPRDVENAIVRIAQMARAVGIHLIVATQRPSVDVVTGLIKANIPSRIALAMATQHDSRTILDQGGAEKLVGHGDMLFMPANANKPHRIQGCYVDEAEISQIVGHCKGQRHADYAPGVVRQGSDAQQADVTGDDADDAALTRAAMDLVVRSGLGSTSMLQRKLKVGFARAGRLMDELETMGVVGPSEGPKARQVLMSVQELEELEERR
jgi:S-DNA-T family DNA segregation ATPase FtsK/SpoIIIE